MAGGEATGLGGTLYDRMALDHDADADSPFRALYERPTTLGLLGPVAGQRVLDAGRGSGIYAAELTGRGASVVGVDHSTAMLAIARRRCPDVEFHLGDLAEPLTFVADASVDAVVCSLTLHYLRDWAPTLREFARVLRPDGRVVISTHHPSCDLTLSESGNYFATELLTDHWDLNGHTHTVRFWRRPLTAIVAAVTDSRFRIDTLVEPMPLPEARRFPREWESLTTKPRFLFLRLRLNR